MNSSKQGSSSSSNGGAVGLMRCSSFSFQKPYSQPEITQKLQSIIQTDKDQHLNKTKEENVGAVGLMRCSSFSFQKSYSQTEITQKFQSMVQADKDQHLKKPKEEMVNQNLGQKILAHIKLPGPRFFGPCEKPKSSGSKQPKDILAAKLKAKINKKLRSAKSFNNPAAQQQDNFSDGVPLRRCSSFIIPSFNRVQDLNENPSQKRKRNENGNENEDIEPPAKKHSSINL